MQPHWPQVELPALVSLKERGFKSVAEAKALPVLVEAGKTPLFSRQAAARMR